MNSQSFEFHELRRLAYLVSVSSRKGDETLPKLRALLSEMEQLERPEFVMTVREKEK